MGGIGGHGRVMAGGAGNCSRRAETGRALVRYAPICTLQSSRGCCCLHSCSS